jgi:uncharacterized protein YfaS (alpha-2-macroglobulin family)
VEALPNPQLPEWIEEISPLGEAATLQQIRVRFAEPVIALEQLDSDSQKQLLQNFELEPPLPGQFRVLTPRMVGFQADRAIPKATRLKVTLKAGLADLKGHSLPQNLAWTFSTEKIQITGLPATQPQQEWEQPQFFDLKPTLTFTANTDLDLKSLRNHVALIPQGSSEPIALEVSLDEEIAQDRYTTPESEFDPSQKTWRYTLKPVKDLTKATQYQLQLREGILPAGGNLASASVFSSEVETYAPLAFQDLTYFGQPDAGGAYGRFQQGLAQVLFNNPLDIESIEGNISLDPPASDLVPLVQAYDGDSYFNLNPWALEPGTAYKVTIGAELKDQFGQTLGKPVTIDYNTGDAAADFWAPDGLNIFPTGQNIALKVSAINLPDNAYRAAFKVLQPEDLVNLDTDYLANQWESLLPPQDQWQTVKVEGTFNQTAASEIALQEKLGQPIGVLAYGVKAKTYQYELDSTLQWREPEFYGLVELTNLGVFAQWFPTSGMVRVHHLDNGYPVGGASVTLYVSDLNLPKPSNPIPCATGTTDATGTLALSAAALSQCYQDSRAIDDSQGSGPSLLVIAREGADWAFAQTNAYSGSYGFGTYTDWDNGGLLGRGLIFSDRQLYQPKETAWFTGVTHYLQNGEIKADANQTYHVQLRTPDGDTLDLGDRITNGFGTFAIEWKIPEDQPLGFYQLEAQRAKNPDNRYPSLYGECQVAEFKPPNFQLDLNLDNTFAVAGKTIMAQVEGKYLFGAPLQGGEIAYFVTREPLENFAPTGWETFNFGPQWFWPEEPPAVEPDVLQTQALLDDSGKGSQAISVVADLPFPMTYRVDAEVKDVSNLSVGNSQSFLALPSDRIIGLRSKFVAQAEQAFEVEVIVTDPNGQPVKGETVSVQLEKMDYSYARRIVSGSESDRNQVTYKSVQTVKVRPGDRPEVVKLTAPEPGAYRIRANFNNAKNEATVTDRQIWATGAGSIFWGRSDNNYLELKLDKETYKPGDTATVLIQSPYESGELYFSVMRDKPLYQTVVQVEGGAPEIKFQVTPEMLPNAAVEAVLVRQGKPLSQTEPGSVENLVRIGLQRFNLDLNSQYLQVAIEPQTPELQPGKEQTVSLKVKDSQGQPVQGQVTVMVVNEAVLQLTGYRPPDLVKTVYAEQPIVTRFDDNRLDVVLQTPTSPLEKGWGYGGGFSAGGANTRTRTDFRPLAYFNPAVTTDRNGEAKISFTLPDDLTTWRILGVAIAQATNQAWTFGNGEATFLTNLPLLANPVLPQFARPGDRLDLGIAVTNSTGQSGQLQIQGNLSPQLEFADSRTKQQMTAKNSIEAKGTNAFRYPVTVTGPGESTIQFSIQLNQNQDAFEFPLPIRTLEITEQVVESGVTDSSVTIPLNIDRQVDREVGGLDLSLASSLIPEIKAPARAVLESDPLPLLEPIASQLLIATDLQILSRRYSQTFAEFKPAEQATTALEALKGLQQADGGFADWPKADRSDPWVTPYAAQAIAQATTAGFTVDPNLMVALRRYLNDLLNDPGKYQFCDSTLCKAELRLETLMALAALGDQRSDFVADIYNQRDKLDPVERIQLARYLTALPDWQAESFSLTEELQKAVYETGRTAKLNLPESWSWLNSPSVLQSLTLQLLVERQARPELRDRLLQGLLALREKGNWGCSYNNAQALNALVAYAQGEPVNANFRATVQLVKKVLATEQLDDRQRPVVDLSVPMANLPQGKADLILAKSGNGNLHYLATYRYRLKGQQLGRYNGLRVTRQVRPANEAVILTQQGLFGTDKSKTQSFTLKAGQVFDIGLEIITDHPIDHLIITDPLPAGLEAIDSNFQTNIPYYQSQSDSWQLSYERIYHDRILAYGEHLNVGVYSLHYLVRSVTPGTFLWPGAEAHLQYSPEEFGRTISSVLKVEE